MTLDKFSPKRLLMRNVHRPLAAGLGLLFTGLVLLSCQSSRSTEPEGPPKYSSVVEVVELFKLPDSSTWRGQKTQGKVQQTILGKQVTLEVTLPSPLTDTLQVDW